MKRSLLSTASEQARMAQFFSHVRDGVVWLDPDAIVEFWSAGAAAIFGRSPDEALDRCYLDLLSPRCRVVQVLPIQRAMEGEDSSVEWQTTGPDGKPMWLEGDFRSVCDPLSKRVGCSILLRDVTRWHAAEKARQASDDRSRETEAHYRLLTENATDLIARLNTDGIFLYVSPASRTMLGIPPEHFIDRHVREFVHESDLPRLSELFDRLRNGQIAQTYSHQCRTHDGSYIWCESTNRAVQDPSGRVTELVMVTRCIEERRKLEAKAQNSQNLQAVGRLAGGVAHDFNNLLTVINGFSEIVLRGLSNPDPVRIASQVQEIRKAGERASTLTRQLLAFGRQQIQTRTRVNLNEVIDETMKLVGRVLGEDVEIETDYCSELNTVHVDVSQIEQVLMNLAVNAREAMPDGGVLTLSTANVTFDNPPEEDVRPGDYVMLAVGDNGAGMNESTRARAFEPFFTTKELGKGTGLGLAMVYGIVKQSDGYIAIESELGKGTTFRIYLPRSGPIAAGTVSRPSSIVRTGRETVLLVEDDDSVRGVTSSILRSLGYRVIEANGGPGALRRCREHTEPIHLLLTDVVMPLMNGREVAECVRAMLPGVKTLFMSGHTDDSILRYGVLDDGVPFLSKPLTHDSLRHKVREVLDQGGSSVN
jgi:PAS domain S-box-containing protein